MGCDIHLFIEYRSKHNGRWRNFGDEFRLNRNYLAFSLMAGIRNNTGKKLAVVEPRGLPEDIDWRTQDANSHFVCSSGDENTVELKIAESWIANGMSKWTNENKNRVTDPDNHTHSWLTPKEYATVIMKMKLSTDPNGWHLEADYETVKVVLKHLEKSAGMSRVVFWFDN